MRSSKYLLCLSLAIAVVFIVQAQITSAQIPGMPKLYGEFKMPEVGAYATYKVVQTENKVERITKLSIVGAEKSKEGDLYWYEVAETNPKTGDVVIVKMLISGNPQEIGTIQRMIMKSGKEAATELPAEILAMINIAPPDTAKPAKPKMKNLGTVKVKVGKETLECAHMQYTSGDEAATEVWTNVKVPLFGVVKSTAATTTMELLEYGTDAVTAIKEEAEVLPMPEGK
ncbi:MAG: hypothetical protein JSV10_02355 [Candidatus Zixiibacteriota bacterium]|nr:MAG: hypothetical protein JSV10_02355 [candidate division Zixibacteria bacterium]